MPPAINYLYGAMAPKFPAYFFSTLLGYLPGTVGTVLAAKGATVGAAAVVLRRRGHRRARLGRDDGRDGPAGLAPARRRRGAFSNLVLVYNNTRER